MAVEQEVDSWTPVTEQEKTAILEQLERLVANAHFHHSKRYPSFLKFVVLETLAGRGDNLKERTLGIEVFGREPTTTPPTIRSSASQPPRSASE
jgi:hypothetical protein